MPSLGSFLKKKRTRDSNPDPSTSNPTSPVTATLSTSPSKTFESSQVGTKAAQAGQASGSPSAPSQQFAGGQISQLPLQQQQDSNMQATATQNDSQNLPTISNLIHQPQYDGSSNNYTSGQFPASTLGPQITHPPSASPGTDPSRMQQEQQQAYPQPTMQSHQQQSQPQYQQQLQQHEQQIHHQQQASVGSQARTTKGKYTLGDFDILRTLGTGSFGRVHLVQSKHNQRFYAIKVLKKAQVVKMKQVEHTNDERRMLSDVKHPFLITLWGTFQDVRNLYMVMDFVEGGELFSLLRKSGVSQQ